MSRRIETFLLATAGAILASGCATAPGYSGATGHPGPGAMSAGDHRCMMDAQHANAGGQPGMPTQCPMMQNQSATDAPSAPSLAPPQTPQQTPDAPAEH